MQYRSILLIDDDEDDQEIFITALQQVSDDATCTIMSSAKEALQKLSVNEINADVIFLDLNMPVMNGQQFLLEIKKDHNLRHLPVIILSTSSHAATIELTKELGAQDFITKPDKFDELLTILQKLIVPVLNHK